MATNEVDLLDRKTTGSSTGVASRTFDRRTASFIASQFAFRLFSFSLSLSVCPAGDDVPTLTAIDLRYLFFVFLVVAVFFSIADRFRVFFRGNEPVRRCFSAFRCVFNWPPPRNGGGVSRTTSDSIRPSIHQSMEFNDEEKTVWKKKEKKRQADVVFFFGGRSCGFQVSMRWIAFFCCW